MSHAQRPRQRTVARSTNLMANQKNKGSRAQNKRNQTMRTKPSTQMANPAARSQLYRERAPIMRSTSQGLTVSNNECLIRWNSQTSSNYGFWWGLNPADDNLFPWLSNISRSYGYYRWKKLRVCFLSACASTAAGDLTIGTFYDYEDASAWAAGGANIVQLTQTQDAVQGPVWSSTSKSTGGRMVSDMMIDIDVDRAAMRTKWHLVDPQTVDAATDNQSVAVYLAQVSTPNGSGNQIFVGSIWVDYEIEFRHPVPFQNQPGLAARSEGKSGGVIIVPANPDGSPLPPKPRPVEEESHSLDMDSPR